MFYRLSDFPCEIGFTNSINYLVEPADLMNVSQFSLDYIEREETSSGNAFEPRFGGHQTLIEREKSFHANNQTLHCGFVKMPLGYPSTKFDLDEKDMTYMQTCKIVVSSCIFGNSDFLRRPTSKKVKFSPSLLSPLCNYNRKSWHACFWQYHEWLCHSLDSFYGLLAFSL